MLELVAVILAAVLAGAGALYALRKRLRHRRYVPGAFHYRRTDPKRRTAPKRRAIEPSARIEGGPAANDPRRDRPPAAYCPAPPPSSGIPDEHDVFSSLRKRQGNRSTRVFWDMASQEIDRSSEGLISFNHALHMRLGLWHTFEVRVAKGALDFSKEHMLREGLVDRGDVTVDQIEIGETMSVELVSKPDEFQIKPKIIGDFGLPDRGYAYWCFWVRPMKSGNLFLEVVAKRIVTVNDKEMPYQIPVYQSTVTVHSFVLDRVKFVMMENKVWSAIFGLAGSAAVAFFTPAAESARDYIYSFFSDIVQKEVQSSADEDEPKTDAP